MEEAETTGRASRNKHAHPPHRLRRHRALDRPRNGRKPTVEHQPSACWCRVVGGQLGGVDRPPAWPGPGLGRALHQHLRDPGRKYGEPVSGWQQQLVSRIEVPDQRTESDDSGPLRKKANPMQTARRQRFREGRHCFRKESLPFLAVSPGCRIPKDGWSDLPGKSGVDQCGFIEYGYSIRVQDSALSTFQGRTGACRR